MHVARITMKVGRLLSWSLAAAVVLALGGCAERHEPGNPFIGPYGSATSEPFAVAPSTAGDAPVLAARQAH